MTIRLALFLLAALSVAGCATKPVNDPGGKWAKQAEQLDNSLFY
ncbi:MAG: hypothetical protein V7704_05150 [Aurantimonas endophytica]|uniref:Lipoprotein n=1 Tax=Aurantimonas endophytica TaxID=1522175 RepID=A0A7W6MNX9_9HYPH|nr:hypothetical protein [Aurantimonas endophytica]MBB4002373.1 hypothetical protein [Aurantimonas endophytica]